MHVMIKILNFDRIDKLQTIAATIRDNYPKLKTNCVPTTTGSLWVVVHREDMVIYSPDHPPVYDPHLVLTISDGNIIYDFKALSQTISKGIFNWEAIETHLNSLKPNSCWTFCPGIKYPTAVHYQSKHCITMKSPYKRHQSDKCKIWHIPNNKKHSPGSQLFNTCNSCKILHNQLSTLQKRHEKFSPGRRSSWKQVSSMRALKYCSPQTGNSR